MNPLAYCTNVHAGPTWPQTQANLQHHTLEVKRLHSPDAPMGVGLWLAAPGARELLASGHLYQLRDWLADQGLIPFTFNGFPYGDFHQPVVKHAVYLPPWWEPARAEYTRDLIKIIDDILPEKITGSISTVPIAWGNPSPDQLQHAAHALCGIADTLHDLESDTGRLVHLNLEPEPGCYLDTAADVVAFFDHYLLPNGEEDRIRRYLRVCHDICHAAVMRENQATVLDTYRRAGIAIGKVQVSAAIALDLSRTAQDDHPAALAQLRSFLEPRYLHQTTVGRGPSREAAFYEDLGPALEASDAIDLRTHFHVPIYLRRFGLLESTQPAIEDFLAAIRPGECEHWEVETYAWTVMPPDLREDSLAASIAREMDWLRQRLPPGIIQTRRE
jgi:hypothetical protein